MSVLTARLGKAARFIVGAALLAALAYLVAQAIWLVGYGPQPPEGLAADAVTIAGPAAAKTLTDAEIRSWHLFGEYQMPGDATEQHTGAPETDLRLTLLGIFHNRTGGGQGWAIIQPENDQVGLYHVGEDIDNGITLDTLRVDHVLLRRAGHLEKLPLLAWDAMPGIMEAPPKTDGEGGDVPLESEAEKLLSNREKSMEQLGIEPVSPGSSSGYRVVDEDGQLVEKFGFQKGDVIVSANGYPLGTEENEILARRSVEGSGIANIIIMRGAREFLVEYESGRSDVRGLDALAAKTGRDGS